MIVALAAGIVFWASEHIGSIAVEQVALDHSSLTLKAGDAETLSATVLYSNNRTDNRVVWTTSNEAVASVDENGVVIAIAPGTTVITAQASKIIQRKALSAQSRCAVNQQGTLLRLARTACVCRKRSMCISPLMRTTLPKSMSLPDPRLVRSSTDCSAKRIHH